MNCRDFEEILIEAARGAIEGRAALEHARSCESCARRLANECALSGGLAAMARHETRRPSPAVEAALLARLAPRPRVRWMPVAAAGAIAAAIAVFLLLPRQRVVVKPPAEQPVEVRPAVQHTVEPPPETQPIRKQRRARLLRAAAPRPEPETARISGNDEFMLIPYAPPLDPSGRAEFVRVDLPVTTLASWGLAAPARDPAMRVNADLMLGEDGLARAIRLVQ